MNTRQIELVQASFAMVRPIADQAAGTFYQRLFEIASLIEPTRLPSFITGICSKET